MNKAKVNRLGYIGSVPGTERDSNSWFTPIEFIEKARQVLGTIDLDPFSSEHANLTVNASRFYSEKNSAFDISWCEAGKVTVWMNPPYGRDLMGKAATKFLQEYYAGHISRGIVLVNNATETQWCQSLLDACTSICLVNKRIEFYNLDGKAVSGNTRGQIFLYFDTRGQQESFETVFSTVGKVFSK